jgi:hypothetical protein
MEQIEIVIHAGAAEPHGTPFFQIAVDFHGLLFENRYCYLSTF